LLEALETSTSQKYGGLELARAHAPQTELPVLKANIKPLHNTHKKEGLCANSKGRDERRHRPGVRGRSWNFSEEQRRDLRAGVAHHEVLNSSARAAAAGHGGGVECGPFVRLLLEPRARARQALGRPRDGPK
jgi:hypothetical protein